MFFTHVQYSYSLAAISTLYFVEHQTKNQHYLSRYEISQLTATKNFGEINGLTQHNWKKYRIDYPFSENGNIGGIGIKGDLVDEQRRQTNSGVGGGVGGGVVGGGGVGGGDGIINNHGVAIIYDSVKQIVEQKSAKSTIQEQQRTQYITHTTTTKHHQATEEEVATIIDADLNWPQRVSDSTLSDVDSNLIDTGHISKQESKFFFAYLSYILLYK